MKKMALFALLCLPVIVNAQKECKNISRTRDDLRDRTTYQSPVLEPVVFVRTIDKDGDRLYLRFTAVGYSITYSAEGLVVLFEDGTKWERPKAKADIDVESVGVYNYSTFISIDSTDLNMFRTKKIAKFGVYVFDATIKERKAQKYVEYANCINNSL